KPKNLDPAILTLAATGTGMDGIDNPGPRASLEELFDEGYAKDPLPQAVIKQLQEGQSRSKQLSLAECEVRNGRLIYRERVRSEERRVGRGRRRRSRRECGRV